jgi:hypothetical protein
MLAVPADDKLLAAIEDLVKMEIPRIPAPEISAAAPTAAPRSRGDEADQAREDTSEDRPRRARRSRKSARPEAEVPGKTPVTASVAPAAAAEAPGAVDVERETEEQPIPDAVLPTPTAAEKPRRDRRGRGRDTGPKQVGLGDHVPDFLLRSFSERTTS